jgi:hypothetical protein
MRVAMADISSLATYERPELRDYGTLADLTAACQGFGSEDGAAKTNDPFIFSQPDFGDPTLCGGP